MEYNKYNMMCTMLIWLENYTFCLYPTEQDPICVHCCGNPDIANFLFKSFVRVPVIVILVISPLLC